MLVDALNTAESLFDLLFMETDTDTVLADTLPREIADAVVHVGAMLVGSDLYPARMRLLAEVRSR